MQTKIPHFEAAQRSFLFPELLAVATVASTATKVRLPGLPLGLGELLLVAWLASGVAFRWMYTGPRWQSGFALRWGGLLFLGLTATLSAGAMLAQATGMTRAYPTAYEGIAWAFVVVLVVWFVTESGYPAVVERYLKAFAAAGTVAAGAILVAAIVTRLAFGSQAFWYQGLRLSGWSENPNQFAALLAPLPFVAWHFRRITPSSAARRGWSVSIFGTLVAGAAAQSDALWLGWILSATILVAVTWLRSLVGRDRTVKSMLVAGVVLPCLAAAAVVPISGLLTQSLESAVEDRANQGGQAGTRVTLWQHGMEAVSLSPAVGWGPGAHSGFATPFEGTESHNSYIDLAAQAGLPVALGVIALFGLAMAFATRSGAVPIALGLLALAVLAVFHNLLRQPVFWFLLFAVLSIHRTRTICLRQATHRTI